MGEVRAERPEGGHLPRGKRLETSWQGGDGNANKIADADADYIDDDADYIDFDADYIDTDGDYIVDTLMMVKIVAGDGALRKDVVLVPSSLPPGEQHHHAQYQSL